MNVKANPLSRIVVFGIAVSSTLLLLSACTQSDTASWPQWRGPNRDGISAEADWNPQALTYGPKVLWQFIIGMGHSNVVIENGRLYTMARNKDGECVLCLDADTGEENWRYKTGERKIPEATPAIDGTFLYALTCDGVLHCLRKRSGKLVWRRDLIEELGAPSQEYGYATSPAVEGDMVIINTKHTGIALDKRSGELIWEGEVRDADDVNVFSTPVFWDHDGRRCVLIFSFPGLFAMDRDTGEQLWYFEWMKKGSPNVVDPVLFDGKVFISSSETDSRGAVLDISVAEPTLLWENHEMANHISSCVYIDGYLYGVDGDYYQNIKKCTLRCLDAESGELMWEEPTGGASLTAADDRLIVLTVKGTIRIAEADPTAYVEISSCELPVETGIPWWWTPPVLCGGKIYCRNHYGELVCIDVSK